MIFNRGSRLAVLVLGLLGLVACEKSQDTSKVASDDAVSYIEQKHGRADFDVMNQLQGYKISHIRIGGEGGQVFTMNPMIDFGFVAKISTPSNGLIEVALQQDPAAVSLRDLAVDSALAATKYIVKQDLKESNSNWQTIMAVKLNARDDSGVYEQSGTASSKVVIEAMAGGGGGGGGDYGDGGFGGGW